MVDKEKKEKRSSIACPHCRAPAGGAFSTVVAADDAGPIEILYKCQSCGGFYTARRVISWEVTNP